jgi:gamma-glutamylcyclotransferase (GGCT)/AIG2-like uncharacterized protein YtfP
MRNLVAVYGSLLKGLGNHRVLGDSTLVGKGTVKGFDMFSLGGFPGIKSGGGSIKVEVYEVENQAGMDRLDCLEGYRGPGESNFYDRTTVPTEYGEAYIYTLENYYDGDEFVPNGDWYGFYTKDSRF